MATRSLLITNYFPPELGGISGFMASVTAALGPERVACLTGVPADGTARDGDFAVRIYRRPAVFAQATWRQALAWGGTVTAILVRERPHIVQLATATEGYLGLRLQRWLGLPFVVYAHGNEVLAAMNSGWPKPRLALQRADRVLANSRFTAELVRQAGAAADRIEVVNPGCDADTLRPRTPSAELRRQLLGGRAASRVVLTVGNIVARKGHDMVIRALPSLCRTVPDVTYLIVGNGPDRRRLEDLATAAGVRDRVVFAGQIAPEALPDVYALSDVFVMPSRAHLDRCDVEGFGQVFLEANACAKPVVAGRSGGISDAVVDGVTGFLVDPHEPQDVAKALARLLKDDELARRFGEEGRSRVVRDFGWPRVAARIQGILDTVVTGGASR